MVYLKQKCTAKNGGASVLSGCPLAPASASAAFDRGVYFSFET